MVSPLPGKYELYTAHMLESFCHIGVSIMVLILPSNHDTKALATTLQE